MTAEQDSARRITKSFPAAGQETLVKPMGMGVARASGERVGAGMPAAGSRAA